MIFFRFIALKKNKTKYPFNIDFLFEKVFNDPFSNIFKQKHIIEMVIYFHLKTENWANETVDIIVKVINFNKKYISYS